MAIDSAGVEPVEPTPIEARVAVHLRHLILAATSRTPDHSALSAAVRQAREAGEGWDVIAMALGITPEAALAGYS